MYQLCGSNAQRTAGNAESSCVKLPGRYGKTSVGHNPCIRSRVPPTDIIMLAPAKTICPRDVLFIDYTNQQNETKTYIVLVTGVEEGDVLGIKLDALPTSNLYKTICACISIKSSATENFESVQALVPTVRSAFRRFKGHSINSVNVL